MFHRKITSYPTVLLRLHLRGRWEEGDGRFSNYIRLKWYFVSSNLVCVLHLYMDIPSFIQCSVLWVKTYRAIFSLACYRSRHDQRIRIQSARQRPPSYQTNPSGKRLYSNNSSCNKLKFSNPCILGKTSCCKPLIFKTTRIYNMKYCH